MMIIKLLVFLHCSRWRCSCSGRHMSHCSMELFSLLMITYYAESLLALKLSLRQILVLFSGGRRRHSNEKPTVSDILYTLTSAMSLLRRCRVNAALTIQVFSQLFHYINMWIFNKLVLQPQYGLCTREWGHRLRRRLGRVETWAKKQGLELAADCHLCRVVQVGC